MRYCKKCGSKLGRRPMDLDEDFDELNDIDDEFPEEESALGRPSERMPTRMPSRELGPPTPRGPGTVLEEKTFDIEDPVRGYTRLMNRLEENVSDTMQLLRREGRDEEVSALQFWMDTAESDLTVGVKELREGKIGEDQMDEIFGSVIDKLMDVSDRFGLGIQVGIGREKEPTMLPRR